jgi:hypothetical protein
MYQPAGNSPARANQNGPINACLPACTDHPGGVGGGADSSLGHHDGVVPQVRVIGPQTLSRQGRFTFFWSTILEHRAGDTPEVVFGYGQRGRHDMRLMSSVVVGCPR